MLSKSETTYIILERKVEDVVLYHEIYKIMAGLGLTRKAFAEQYPMLLKLHQALRVEKENFEE